MRQFGKFRILKELGKGGMGAVYEAELSGPGDFRKAVALKILTGEAATIDGLAREASLGGLLRHPNLVDTYEFGQVDGVAYIAMELVDGPTLSALLRGRALPPDAVVQIVQQIATGLSHAHGAKVDGVPLGLVHRDLKPANVLVSRFGVVKVADFGIATTHLERDRTSIGTPGYMSPEQWFGHAVDARSDLWALGAILYRCIVGRPLLKRGVGPMALHGMLASDLIQQEVDARAPGLGPIVQSCLQLDPEARPGRAGQVKRALAQVPPTGTGDLASVLGHALQDFAMSQLIGTSPTADTETRPELPPTVPLPEVDRNATTVVVEIDNLGVEPDRFVGRADAIADARQRLASGAKVLTFKGPGGVGTSRLATHLARKLPGAFGGGRLLVDATSCHGVSDLVRAMSGPLRIDLGSSAVQVEQAIARAGDLLLILDGCDALPEDAAQLVAGLLVRLPRLRLFVTGRSALGLPGEQIVELGPLPDADAQELFRARSPGRDGPGLIDLVEALDRHPLAIELAAERARLMPIDRLLEMVVADPLRLLRTSRRGVPERHRSLDACVRHTWDALSADARRAAVQLTALGRTTVDWELLGKVVQPAGGPDDAWALDAVSELGDRSFIRLQDDGQVGLPRLHQVFVRSVAEVDHPGLLDDARRRAADP